MELDFYGDFTQWDKYIDELQEAEYKLLVLKEEYQTKSEEIIQNTDFKEIYGRNNESIRELHVKNELHTLVDDINDLKLLINDRTRRIEFLKGLTRLKTEMIRYDKGVE